MTKPEELGIENGIGAMPILGGEPNQVMEDIRRIQTYVLEHSRHKIPALIRESWIFILRMTYFVPYIQNSKPRMRH